MQPQAVSFSEVRCGALSVPERISLPLVAAATVPGDETAFDIGNNCVVVSPARMLRLNSKCCGVMVAAIFESVDYKLRLRSW
jgi:hypothetical protein